MTAEKVTGMWDVQDKEEEELKSLVGKLLTKVEAKDAPVEELATLLSSIKNRVDSARINALYIASRKWGTKGVPRKERMKKEQAITWLLYEAKGGISGERKTMNSLTETIGKFYFYNTQEEFLDLLHQTDPSQSPNKSDELLQLDAKRRLSCAIDLVQKAI